MGKFSDRLASSRGSAEQAKISERLMNFAGPLLPDASALAPDDVETSTRSAVMIAVAIWNAHIFEAIGKPEIAIRTRALAETSPGTARGNVIAEMSKRKAEHFADDLRLITDFTVFRNDAGVLRINVSYQTAEGDSA